MAFACIIGAQPTMVRAQVPQTITMPVTTATAQSGPMLSTNPVTTGPVTAGLVVSSSSTLNQEPFASLPALPDATPIVKTAESLFSDVATQNAKDRQQLPYVINLLNSSLAELLKVSIPVQKPRILSNNGQAIRSEWMIDIALNREHYYKFFVPAAHLHLTNLAIEGGAQEFAVPFKAGPNNLPILETAVSPFNALYPQPGTRLILLNTGERSTVLNWRCYRVSEFAGEIIMQAASTVAGLRLRLLDNFANTVVEEKFDLSAMRGTIDREWIPVLDLLPWTFMRARIQPGVPQTPGGIISISPCRRTTQVAADEIILIAPYMFDVRAAGIADGKLQILPGLRIPFRINLELPDASRVTSITPEWSIAAPQ